MHPWALAALGGALIGLAATLLLLFNGRIAGITGIAAGLLTSGRGEIPWRASFIGGLVLGGVAMAAIFPSAFGPPLVRSAPLAIGAGLLVGVGTRLANGCTSGHGVCGLARLSPRSLVATGTFMSAAAVTVFFVRHVIGSAS